MKTKLLSCVTYANINQLKTAISIHGDQVQDCIAIMHDKDLKADGTPKESHLHYLLSLNTSREISEVTGWLKKCTDDKGQVVNTFCESVKSTKAAIDYLRHIGQDGKHEYSEHDIIILQGSKEHWLSLEGEFDKVKRKSVEKQHHNEEKAEEIDQLVQDCINNVPERNMAQKYGRDYIKNRRVYREFAAIVRFQETGEIEEHLVHDVIEEICNILNITKKGEKKHE